MILRLNSLKVGCIIGERDYERKIPQDVFVDVELEIEDKSAVSDELADTVDYAALSGEISEALVKAKCKMIERSSRIVCETCLKQRSVISVKATVTKFGAVENLKSASCECILTKESGIC